MIFHPIFGQVAGVKILTSFRVKLFAHIFNTQIWKLEFFQVAG